MKPYGYLLLLLGAAHLRISAKAQISASPVKIKKDTIIKYDDTRKIKWGDDFKAIKIKSSKDSTRQLAYCYLSTSKTKQPVIISLHTWSGDYTQTDPLAVLVKQKNLNYIHPDFRGTNNKPQACCSELALSDIEDVVDYAEKLPNADTSRIFITGVSGGGYATLASFMKLKHQVKKYSAWAPITDIATWYNDSKQLKSKYWKDIEKCTGMMGASIDTVSANQRSPMHFATPANKFNYTKLDIYEGVNDGITGSVPITHAINFYNKLLKDMGVKDKNAYVSAGEIQELLQTRKPLGSYGKIGNRAICLQKSYKNLRLTIFDGTHEMLPEYALADLVQ